MNRFYYHFTYIPPGLADSNKRLGTDFQDSMSFWVESENREQAIEWGNKLAAEYVGILYTKPSVPLAEYGLTVWYEGEVDDRGPTAGWSDEDKKKYWTAEHEEKLKKIPVVKDGEYPDIKKIIEERYGPGPY